MRGDNEIADTYRWI